MLWYKGWLETRFRLLVALGIVVGVSAQSQPLKLVSTEWPPFTNPTGQPRFALAANFAHLFDVVVDDHQRLRVTGEAQRIRSHGASFFTTLRALRSTAPAPVTSVSRCSPPRA